MNLPAAEPSDEVLAASAAGRAPQPVSPSARTQARSMMP